jgi:hypothetical protein
MMVLFSQRAAENVNPVYERWAMTFGAGIGARMRHTLIPGTVPEIIGGLRITLASAWGLEVFAEILGAPSGIGQAIKALTNLSNVPGLLACVVIVAVTAIVTDILLVVLMRRVAPASPSFLCATSECALCAPTALPFLRSTVYRSTFLPANLFAFWGARATEKQRFSTLLQDC